MSDSVVESPTAESPSAASSSNNVKDKKGKTPKRQLTLGVDDEPLATDDGSDDIHLKLRRLRRKEVQALSTNPTNKRSASAADHYVQRFFLEGGRYLRYVAETWSGMLVTTCFGGLGPFDYFTMWVYAFGGTVVLWFVLWFCLIVNSPVLRGIYADWSKKDGGGLGIVNSSNPNLFKSMTKDQADAGKRFLSKPISESKDDEGVRHFNYDASKLLLQLAAIVYEHPNEAVRAAVIKLKGDQPGAASAAAPGATPTSVADATPQDTAADQNLDKTLDSDGDSNIRKFCNDFGLDFEPVSELNNTSSAFAGLFWDPKSNWIVVSFKGTSPIEFGEWLSDLNTKLSSVGSHIPGFRKVHKGFKDRVYPDDVRAVGGVRPYDTIKDGIKALAKHLRKTNRENPAFTPDTQINVWFTGHSLGCATASLVYCRFLMRHKDMGKRSVLRDAYLYACPILSDRDTVDVFNAKMMEDKKRPKTMWRITSNGDFVATCLPELGDYTSIAVSANNAFAFAHLGTEIKLVDHPYACKATGNHLFYGTDVKFESEFSMDKILAQRAEHNAKEGEANRQWWGRLSQSIPLIGRFFAHEAVLYWDQLDRIAIDKQAEWAYN